MDERDHLFTAPAASAGLSDRSDRLKYDLPAEVQIGYRLKYSISVFRPGLLVRDARLNRVVVRVDGGYYFIRGTDVVHTAFKASYELRGAQRRLLRQTDFRNSEFYTRQRCLQPGLPT